MHRWEALRLDMQNFINWPVNVHLLTEHLDYKNSDVYKLKAILGHGFLDGKCELEVAEQGRVGSIGSVSHSPKIPKTQ